MRPDAQVDVGPVTMFYFQFGNLVSLATALALRKCFAERQLVDIRESLQSARHPGGFQRHGQQPLAVSVAPIIISALGARGWVVQN
jgi:hypothetical protein